MSFHKRCWCAKKIWYLTHLKIKKITTTTPFNLRHKFHFYLISILDYPLLHWLNNETSSWLFPISIRSFLRFDRIGQNVFDHLKTKRWRNIGRMRGEKRRYNLDFDQQKFPDLSSNSSQQQKLGLSVWKK